MTAASSLSILVVEDDEGVRGHVVDVLEIHGHSVCAVATGDEGFAAARERGFDLIITDLTLPGMDGFALIEAIRGTLEQRTVPIIVITASTEPGRMRRAMTCGADDYILKPFSEEDLMRSIRVRMEKKALLDELDAFAHTVAHDLKNPIAVVQGRAELLRLRWARMDDAKKQEQVDEILAGTHRLLNIIDELLLLAGVRKASVRPEPLDMQAIVGEALARVQPMVERQRAQVIVSDHWPPAFGHAAWVAEIWTNYLSNAVKYGGRPPRVELGAEPASHPGFARFWVRDNGLGLDESQRQRLFIPFNRLSDLRLEGSGLGLSIAARIAERLHGRVGVAPNVGDGSCFWFELPNTPTAAENETAI